MTDRAVHFAARSSAWSAAQQSGQVAEPDPTIGAEERPQ